MKFCKTKQKKTLFFCILQDGKNIQQKKGSPEHSAINKQPRQSADTKDELCRASGASFASVKKKKSKKMNKKNIVTKNHNNICIVYIYIHIRHKIYKLESIRRPRVLYDDAHAR